MDIRYIIIQEDGVINVTDIDESIVSWFIPHLATIFPTWELIPLSECVKRDDGNPAGIWIGWARDELNEFYDPNYVPEEP